MKPYARLILLNSLMLSHYNMPPTFTFDIYELNYVRSLESYVEGSESYVEGSYPAKMFNELLATEEERRFTFKPAEDEMKHYNKGVMSRTFFIYIYGGKKYL